MENSLKYKIVFYKTKTQSPVEDFIKNIFNTKLQAKTIRLLELLGDNFDMAKNSGFTRKVKRSEKLYELRVEHSNNICRFFFAFDKMKIIIVLHGFIKKTQHLPSKEIEIAENRLLDYVKRKSKNG